VSDPRKQALDELHLQLHTRRLCLEAGYDLYPRAIFSGNLGARLMVIGQAPGISPYFSRKAAGMTTQPFCDSLTSLQPRFRYTKLPFSITRFYVRLPPSGRGAHRIHWEAS
jgi:hypothetical protein